MKAYKIREQINGIEEPPGKTWFFALQAGVIDAGRCIQCGTCVAACPSGSIVQNLFDDEEIFSEIEGVLAHE